MSRKLILTLGDPYSVNIELLNSCLSPHKNISTILVGSAYHFQNQSSLSYTPIKNFEEAKPNTLSFLDIGGVQKPADTLSPRERGEISNNSLYALFPYVNHSKEKLAVLTCPIDKFAAHAAGFSFAGHTEFFSEKSSCETLMLLAGPKLRVGLATNHLALKDVSKTLNIKLIQKKLSILHSTLKNLFHISSPHIAVCGLNPHCSDGGLFGDEEELFIKPAIQEFQKSTPDRIHGPLPADTVFYRALNNSYDAVLAMYHDQGLGPLKTVHFDEAVNITCGLPYLRVSPDHGPAKDLFMQNKASVRSMQEALSLALHSLGESKT